MAPQEQATATANMHKTNAPKRNIAGGAPAADNKDSSHQEEPLKKKTKLTQSNSMVAGFEEEEIAIEGEPKAATPGVVEPPQSRLTEQEKKAAREAANAAAKAITEAAREAAAAIAQGGVQPPPAPANSTPGQKGAVAGKDQEGPPTSSNNQPPGKVKPADGKGQQTAAARDKQANKEREEVSASGPAGKTQPAAAGEGSGRGDPVGSSEDAANVADPAGGDADEWPVKVLLLPGDDDGEFHVRALYDKIKMGKGYKRKASELEQELAASRAQEEAMQGSLRVVQQQVEGMEQMRAQIERYNREQQELRAAIKRQSSSILELTDERKKLQLTQKYMTKYVQHPEANLSPQQLLKVINGDTTFAVDPEDQ
jgi:type II secretory pathway pseudopilin PulG